MSVTELIAELEGIEGVRARPELPFARRSVYRMGGPVELYISAETAEAVQAAAKATRDHGLKLQGLEGLEVMVRGDGAPGAWLRPGQVAEGILPEAELQLDVGAWVPAAMLAGWAMRRGLGGFEHLGGRGGTVAEAFRAGELDERALELRVLRGVRLGKLTPRQLKDGHTLLRLRLKGREERASRVRAQTQRSIERRRGRGPGLPGRLMEDPKGDNAAELMAEAGLCGVRLRGARLGVREPNSVINLGGARPSDLKLLATLARDRVKLLTGVELTPAIKPAGGRR